jgi:hypothetical protein
MTSRRSFLRSVGVAETPSARGEEPDDGSIRLQEFGYGDVELAPGPTQAQFEQTCAALLSLNEDSLLKPFRLRACTQRQRPHPGRQELPADLPRVDRVIGCAPEQFQCSHGGQPMTVIGYETSEQLDVEPATYFVLGPGARSGAVSPVSTAESLRRHRQCGSYRRAWSAIGW